MENDESISLGLSDVRRAITSNMADTPLHSIADDLEITFLGGKMLRARLILRVGGATDMPHGALITIAAATEMIHAASLLHDDVIDCSPLRRGHPSFWVQRGITGAVLLGDLAMCRAVTLVSEATGGALVSVLLEMMTEMCSGVVEQELILKDTKPDWPKCVSIARRKTGSLLAFASHACANGDKQLSEALTEAGYLLGTAYQLADDILDAYGDPSNSDKTLGTDAADNKTTAATSWNHSLTDPIQYITRLCEDSASLLLPWPAVNEAWRDYMEKDVTPTVHGFVEHFSSETV